MNRVLRLLAAAICRIGYGAVRLGFIRVGETFFRFALVLSPRYAVALRWLAWCVRETGDPEQAIAYYKELLRQDPSFVDGRVELAFLLASRDRHPEAIEQFQVALATSLAHAGARKGLVISLIHTNHSADAIAVCEQLARDAPSDADAWGWLGRARSETGKWNDALTAYETAYTLGVDAAVVAEHAGVLMELDRYAEAEALLTTALRMHPGDTNLRVQIASVFAEDGRYADAENTLREVVQDHPRHVQAHSALAAVLAMSGRASESLAIAERLVQQCPDDADAYASLAWVASKSGRADDALRGYDRALRMRPGRLEFLAGRATALKQLGRHSEAENVVKEIVARDPSFLDRNTGWPELKTFRQPGNSKDHTR